MSKKAKLQEQVRALGLDPEGNTIAQLEKIIADNQSPDLQPTPTAEEKEEEPEPSEEPQNPVIKEPETAPSIEVNEPEEVEKKEPPVGHKKMREPSFMEKCEAAIDVLVNYINKGGDEKKVKEYLKELAK
ncbi:MAG: hypothetical protein AB3N18_04590 [Allomuricauda sp.]